MATQQGIEAMESCAEKAEDLTAFSVEWAQKIVLKKLTETPKLTGETLTLLCKDEGCIPHDDRAFGSVLRGLSVNGRIQKVGYGPRHRGHGTAGAIVWSLA